MTRHSLNKGLIVSCQAVQGEPLWHCNVMHLMARSAVQGGAAGIRCLCEDIASIRREVNVPIIGLVKQVYADSEVYITPTRAEADQLIAAAPDVIALDATLRPRPNGATLEGLVAYLRERAPEIALMADIATEAEALNANRLGFDYVSTTLRGYTDETRDQKIPDYAFIRLLKRRLKQKLVVEGGIWEVGQLKKIVRIKPYAVVIGTSITRPRDIVKRFSSVIERGE